MTNVRSQPLSLRSIQIIAVCVYVAMRGIMNTPPFSRYVYLLLCNQCVLKWSFIHKTPNMGRGCLSLVLKPP